MPVVDDEVDGKPACTGRFDMEMTGMVRLELDAEIKSRIVFELVAAEECESTYNDGSRILAGAVNRRRSRSAVGSSSARVDATDRSECVGNGFGRTTFGCGSTSRSDGDSPG